MTWWILLLAVAGLIWLYVSLEKGLKRLGNELKEKGLKGIRSGFSDNPYLRDFFISIACIMIGWLLFVGVTGMVIGLLASFGLSAYIEVKHLITRRK